MLHWRAENSSLLLETEVDALSQDEDGYTPLVQSYHFAYCFFFNGLQHSLVTLPARKEAGYTLNKRLGGSEGWSGCVWKISPSWGV